MSAEALEIIYKCRECMTQERKLNVRSRAGNEDVRTWMDSCVNAISRDHASQSPHCTSQTMEYLKIPVGNDESAHIGGPVKKAVQ